METTLAIKDELLKTYEELVRSIIGAMPKVLTALILIIVALCVAKLVETALRALLSRIGLDSLMKRLEIDRTLSRIGIRQPLSRFIPRVLYFLLLFLFARTAADALGLGPVSQALGSFLSFMPNLLSAFLVLVFGSLAGQFAGRAVSEAARGSGIDYAPSLGSAVSGLILFIAAIMAVGQLRIDTDIVRIVTFCSLAALGLAFGLSFGLGTRQITENIMAGFYARKVFRIGDPVEIRGQRGKLQSITTTLTLIEKEDETIAVANRAFLEDVIKL